jgi:hypothetical protein
MLVGHGVSPSVGLLLAERIHQTYRSPAAAEPFYRKNDTLLFPVGGVLQLLGGLLTGIAVVIAKRWNGWQRFALLLQGSYYLIVLFVPIAIANRSPTQLGESIWQVTWFITSLALFTKSGNQ